MAFNKLFGADDAVLIAADNSKVTVGSLKGADKYFGIYFSAHWCPPCKMFTPMLAKFYKAMKATGRNLEIVFASSDQSEEQFNEYRSEMPWVSFPFNDARIRAASSKFKVSGIPTLVLLDGEGKLITDAARGKVMSDPEGADFPWRPPTLEDVVSGITFTTKDGAGKTWADMQKNDAVAFYFSAHWCGPCRAFTPQLTKTYKKIVGDGKGFEVVFVSSDRDQGGFDEYYGSMPWAALPFSDRGAKEKLSEMYGVQGIPSLIIVDPKTGKTISDNGRARVMGDKDGAEFPWLPKPCEELGAGPDVNTTAILSLLVDDVSDGAAADASVAALKKFAKEKKDQWTAASKEEEPDFPIDFGYGDEDCGIVGPIRSFTNLRKSSPVLFILDVPNGKKFMWSGTGFPTADDFAAMVDGYVAGTLPSVGIKDTVA